MDDQQKFLREIACRLDSAEISYMVTGSLAMAFYSEPRMTRDVDIVIDCGPEDADRIAELFEPDCYVDRGSVREAISKRSSFNVIHNGWIVKADFIVRKDESYRKREFERRRSVEIEGTTFSVVAAEDLVLSKLLWASETDSDIQLRDARAIVKSAGDLDRAYLEKWALALGIGEALEEVRGR